MSDIQSFQQRAVAWVQECFGPEMANDPQERNHRFLEEAIELAQSCGCSKEEVLQIVDYVFSRPVGDDKASEVGGAMNTLAALCGAHGIDMDEAADRELEKCHDKTERIRAKRQSKPTFSAKYQALPLTSDRAAEIYDDPRREAQCIEYHLASVQVDKDIAKEVCGDEAVHKAQPYMLAALLAAQVIFLNSHHWEKEWPEDAQRTVALCVGCSDVFAWACADAEGLEYSEIESLFDDWQKDPVWGSAVWCMKKRNLMPQPPVEKAIRESGIWNLDELGLRPSPFATT
jgi:hypothetical protein